MNRQHHHVVGAAAGAVLASASGLGLWQSAATVVLAASVAALPDTDQGVLWRFADRWLPDEALGHGGPMRHRGITHWWALPVLWVVAVLVWIPDAWRWPLWALIAGWVSHLVADFVVGARSRQRGPGIPLAPWWAHIGLGARCDGVVDWLVTVACVVGAVGLVLVRVTGADVSALVAGTLR